MELFIAIIFCLFGNLLMVSLFTYLYKQTKLRYLKFWAFGWGVLLCKFIFQFIYEGVLNWRSIMAFSEILEIISIFLILVGIREFMKKGISKKFIYSIIIFSVGIIVIVISNLSIAYQRILLTIIYGFIMIETARFILFNSKGEKIGKIVISLTSIFGGIFLISYGLKYNFQHMTPIWYLTISFIGVLLGLGLLFLHYERIKNELEISELNLKNNKLVLEETIQKINSFAYYDSLTGLPNKTFFVEKLKNELDKDKNELHKGAALFIDFDNFKKVNDVLGHAHGDEILKNISENLKNCIGKTGIAARFGGDEFIILQTDIKDIYEVTNLAQKILDVFAEKTVINDYEFHITASIGIVVYNNQEDNVQDILKNSDSAMYRAKYSGKNKYCFFEKSMEEEMKQKLDLEKSIKKAIENKEFILYFQPQVDIKTNKIKGAEALVRWIHPFEGMISPGKFIPLAEDTGLIVAIGEFVLREACKQNKQWHEHGYSEMGISVNVSELQLQEKNFVKTVKDILDDTKLDPQHLILEITESMLMKSLDENVKILEELRNMGIKIALDDFGTGYSSLNYLVNLPIDIMKIDKSFVDDIISNSKKEVIVGTLISLAQTMQLKVVTEGIETKKQLEILIKHKCDIVQGYYFSRPLPLKDFEELIDSKQIKTTPR